MLSLLCSSLDIFEEDWDEAARAAVDEKLLALRLPVVALLNEEEKPLLIGDLGEGEFLATGDTWRLERGLVLPKEVPEVINFRDPV